MHTLDYPIDTAHDGMTVEKYLKSEHGYSSRTLIKLKKLELGISINGEHARTIDRLRAGDILRTAILGEDCPYARSNRKAALLFEDENIVVFDKPPGMPCHTSCGHHNDTLVNVFASYCDSRGISCRFRALNRLDADTSGCVLVAKSQYAASRLRDNFGKVYVGVVCGSPPDSGIVDTPIIRPDPVDMRRAAAPGGQPARTLYRVLARGGGYALVRFDIETGRTHQIRVHMAHIGFPIAGDAAYGSDLSVIGRQALHCSEISFAHPISGEQITVRSPLPADIRAALETAGIEEYEDTGRG